MEVTVRFETAALKNAKSIRLFREEDGKKTPRAYQVLESTSHKATDSFASIPQTFVRLVFLADVPAGGTVTYSVALEGAPPPSPAGLKVSGEGVGATIDTGSVIFELHPPSGQLMTFLPRTVSRERIEFRQFRDRGPLPFHWNPDVWPTGKPWGHTSDWTRAVAFDRSRHDQNSAPGTKDNSHPFFFRQWRGPLLYRLTRWGRMPHVPEVGTDVSYTFFAGAPYVMVASSMEFDETISVHAVRNAELVFSRHQFDTAVWITRAGKLRTSRAYDHENPDRSFGDIARLPSDVPCLGLASERGGFGIALIHLSLLNMNQHTGNAADEGAHFYIRDYDEHGKGSPKNFLYFARPVVYRDGYLPTSVSAGSVYASTSAIVVFELKAAPSERYDELIRWQKALTHPLEVVVD